MVSICYISPLSIHSTRYIEAFAQKNYKTFVISDSKTWVAPTPKNTKVFTLPKLNKQTIFKRSIPNLLHIVRLLDKIRPDIVDIHMQHHYGLPVVLRRYPYTLTSWGLEVLKLPEAGFLKKKLAIITANMARKITVDARCLKEIWVSMGIPESKINVIPFGVDLSTFNPNVKGSFIRKNLRIMKDDIAIISTRPFYKSHYNIECLIKAIPLILKRCQNAKFIIKGTGPLKIYLENLVNKLNVSNHVRFVGLTSHYEMAQYLAAADIYVSTAFIDTTSVSLLEAMACGLPPIVTDIAGNKEWINDEVNGLLFPPENSIALSEKVIQLINNENTRRHFGERCFQIVKQRASWEDCVNKMETIYQSLI